MSYFYMPKEEYMSNKELKANGIGVLLDVEEIELTSEGAIEILNSQRPKPCLKAINKAYDKAIEALSRNNESLTDLEQQIFLSAMAREEDICGQVDNDMKDGTVKLVDICHSIKKKVRGTLWK